MAREGILFVGDQGAIMAGFHGQNPQLFAKGKTRAAVATERLRRRAPDARPAAPASATRLWLEAVQGRRAVARQLPERGGISDAVNLGTVALRAGKKVLFDSENMKITNVPEANKYLVREYRKGWEL